MLVTNQNSGDSDTYRTQLSGDAVKLSTPEGESCTDCIFFTSVDMCPL